VRATLPSTALLCAAFLGVSLGGCQRLALRQRVPLEKQLPRITSEELFQIGLLQAGRGDLLRAEQYLIAARNQGYDESAVVYWLVRVCVSAGRYHSALGHAARYLRAHPSNWRLRLVVASIHEALGDLPRAQAELESIVDAEPDRALPRYRLAMVYRQRSLNHEHAARHLAAYLDLRPNGPHAAEVRTMLGEGSDLAFSHKNSVQVRETQPDDGGLP
jgi:tetratricopeptide (TPR) repeat protein